MAKKRKLPAALKAHQFKKGGKKAKAAGRKSTKKGK
jgi:hypothetical protein